MRKNPIIGLVYLLILMPFSVYLSILAEAMSSQIAALLLAVAFTFIGVIYIVDVEGK